jgi:hypothetical protein
MSVQAVVNGNTLRSKSEAFVYQKMEISFNITQISIQITKNILIIIIIHIFARVPNRLKVHEI